MADFDIQGKITEIVSKLKDDKNLLAKFKNDPIKTVEDLIGVDLPDEAIKSIVAGVKAKVGAGSILDKIKAFFSKK